MVAAWGARKFAKGEGERVNARKRRKKEKDGEGKGVFIVKKTFFFGCLAGCHKEGAKNKILGFKKREILNNLSPKCNPKIFKRI